MRALACSREALLAAVAAADPSLSGERVATAFDAAITGGTARRSLAQALAEDPDALGVGAPPVVTRLVGELVARGSTTFTLPACARCRRTGRGLTRSDEGGVCAGCRRRQLAQLARAATWSSPWPAVTTQASRCAPAALSVRGGAVDDVGGSARSPAAPVTGSPTCA